MWMLLNKQVLNRQSAACAQNETATFKCLRQDVHQSVVFQKKFPNNSSHAYKWESQPEEVIFTSGEEERFLITQKAAAADTCGRAAAT